MRRRDFVETVGRASLAAAVLPRKRAPSRAKPLVWAWVGGDAASHANGWRDRFAYAKSLGVSGVLVGEVDGDHGGTTAVAYAAEKHELQLHRWWWTLNRKGDPWVQQAHPEWFTVSREGRSSLAHPPYVDYYRWLCPTRPEVREYLARDARGVAQERGVWGVHMDYVRHCDVILPRALWAKYGLVQDRELPQFDFCYCEVCRAEFKRVHGTDPLDLEDPAADQRWRRFRWDSVTGAVRRIAEAVQGEGRRLTAAVFPTPTIARTLVRQAWDEWPLDAAFPMLYHRFYEEDIPWIGRSAREGVAAMKGRPLHAGLYLPDLAPDELHAAARAALDAGAAGVALFNLADLTDADGRALVDALR
jgi:uncharacterized lipoprotein YddW (UPF0748 family)